MVAGASEDGYLLLILFDSGNYSYTNKAILVRRIGIDNKVTLLSLVLFNFFRFIFSQHLDKVILR